MATPIAASFGTALRRRREDSGMSQEVLADRAELHRTYVSLIERGIRTPSIEAVRRLAAALGTSMADLIADAENGAPATRPGPRS